MSLPRGHGPAVLAARFRASPEDFRVDEQPSFEASGAGEHLLLTIEKRGLNTVSVEQRLAKWAGTGDVGIGYAGMKDRHAVTTQRFSVHLPGRESPDTTKLEFTDATTGQSLRVIEAHRHSRKISRGALAGNAFTLVLRDVVGERDAIEARLAAIAQGGIPNYFGEQRFGRGGDNVESARRMFAGARMRREERSILLSAARSEIFNAVLAARIDEGNWSGGIDGEVWMLEGTHSVFGPEPLTDALRERALRLDIHPTGVMWGRGALRSHGAALALESAAVEPFADLRAGLEAAGLKQERRALRVRVADVAWNWLEAEVLELKFGLPAGAYATEVLAELGECVGAQ
ncbi:MAG: tRNA pseudouridine(13) synthase TruD [Arenimonas sp.]